MMPLVVLATVDPVLRDAAVFSLLTDLPGTGFVRQDMDPGSGTVRRVAGDADGLVDDVTEPFAHGCPGCVQRENLLPAMEAMAGRGRWSRMVLALPVAGASAPAARPLADPALRRRLGVELATVVCVVDVDGYPEQAQRIAFLAQVINAAVPAGGDGGRVVVGPSSG